MAFTISMPSLRTAGSRGANLAGLPTCSGAAEGCVMQQLRDGTLDTTDVPRWASTWARAFGFRLTRLTADLPSHQRLIGMSGREIVQARLQRFMSDPARAGESMVVMRIDIDDLESVNEALSLEAGDLVLEAVADRIVGGQTGHLHGRGVAKLGCQLRRHFFAVMLLQTCHAYATLISSPLDL